jgi:hypothetical protein
MVRWRIRQTELTIAGHELRDPLFHKAYTPEHGNLAG